jgi:RNA polymerase sigma factor (sigma-70 family)
VSEDAQLVLLDYLSKRYANLKLRLTRLLGNSDLASDALHDTWMRLKGKDDYGPIQSPGAYVVRMAVNIAVDIQRRQSRTVSVEDIDAVLADVVDPAPGPEHLAAARSDMDALLKFVDRMPERRRACFLLVHAEGLTQKEAAKHLGIPLRAVEYEMKCAHTYLSAHIVIDKN